MGATVSGPSITVDETAETITLTAGATIPTSFLRVIGCETMTVTAEAEVTRKIKALDVVPATGGSFSTASLVFGTSYLAFNRGGFQLVRCPLWVMCGP